MLLNSFIKFICVKKLYFQRYSFSKFEFPNMHIFIGDFTRHYCDVKGVNGVLVLFRKAINYHV